MVKLLPVPEPALKHHLERFEKLMAQWHAQSRVPPVLLMTGLPGVGKRSMTYHLAQWLLCERTGFQEAPAGLFGTPEKSAFNPRPCGECSQCQRALHQNWVDVTEIAPEESGVLKIEQFRTLKASQGFGAFDGAFRVILIRDADRMTPQAANSLLKLLEEPPRGWIFLLTATDSSLLLPTIVSRCQVLRLRPFDVDTLVELLKQAGIAEERRRECATLAQGSWGQAIQLADDKAAEQRAKILLFIEKPVLEMNNLVDWAASDPSALNLLLSEMERAIATLLNWSLEPKPSLLTHPALQRHAIHASQRLGSAEKARTFWLARLERLFQARREAQAPLNRKLLAQDILAPWLEL